MKLTISETDGTLTCALNGRLDTAAADGCAEEMQPLFDKADSHIIIDCTNLDYISSSGLRIFLSLRKKVGEKNGSLVISNLNTEIQNVFNLTGFSKIFEIK